MNGVGDAEDEAGDRDLGAACASLALRELGLVGQVAVVVPHEYRHGISRRRQCLQLGFSSPHYIERVVRVVLKSIQNQSRVDLATRGCS